MKIIQPNKEIPTSGAWIKKGRGHQIAYVLYLSKAQFYSLSHLEFFNSEKWTEIPRDVWSPKRKEIY